MSDVQDRKYDPRSVDELFTAALTLSYDDERMWNAVAALHCRGSKEVLARAVALCDSSCSRERRLAADVLGQLGVPDRTFPEESFSLLCKMCHHGEDADVLQAVFVAFA